MPRSAKQKIKTENTLKEAIPKYQPIPSVLDVAQYILKQMGELTTWKLQKLVYYGQAWSCVWDDQPLFPSVIHAWVHGPVCLDLYEAHKNRFTARRIRGGKSSRIGEREKDVLDRVIKFYGSFSGQELSDLTCDEDPWRKARKGFNWGERGEHEIPLDSMVEYYSALLSHSMAEGKA